MAFLIRMFAQSGMERTVDPYYTLSGWKNQQSKGTCSTDTRRGFVTLDLRRAKPALSPSTNAPIKDIARSVGM
jgi:hypothetical protein